MKVALLGPEGTYTHEAAIAYFGDFEPVFCNTIPEVFSADADAAITPFENSLGGNVSEVIDLLNNNGVTVTGEQNLKINHCLISKHTNISKIETVKSHPQALAQSKEFIEKHGFETEETSSTADAVENLGDGEAALASETAAKINNLNIIEKGVQDNDNNTTRFLILDGEQSEDCDKTAMILTPGDDRAGLLHSMLSCLAGHNINLSHIQSRPTKNRLGEYYFYIEAEAGANTEQFERAKKCLETYTDVNILGTYPKGELK